MAGHDKQTRVERVDHHARIAVSPIVPQEMIAMAARLHEIANSTSADFGAILEVFNDELMTRSPSKQVAQQQQQVQPRANEE